MAKTWRFYMAFYLSKIYIKIFQKKSKKSPRWFSEILLRDLNVYLWKIEFHLKSYEFSSQITILFSHILSLKFHTYLSLLASVTWFINWVYNVLIDRKRHNLYLVKFQIVSVVPWLISIKLSHLIKVLPFDRIDVESVLKRSKNSKWTGQPKTFFLP